MDANESDYKYVKNLGKRKSSASAILLGIGLAGLVDIIIFHAILQWHHTSSHIIIPNTMDSLQLNILHDGVFLSFSLMIMILGTVLLLYSQDIKNRNYFLIHKKSFVGLLLIGFGGFNTIEGMINHHILQMHHVIEVADPIVFDVTFLAVGGLTFLAMGAILYKSQRIANKYYDYITIPKPQHSTFFL
jgi:uncharacterized membrane protein